MTQDHAIDVLSSAFKQLAEGGFVCSGEISFIKPRTPGLVTSEAAFVLGEVPCLLLRTVRSGPVPANDEAHAEGFISGDTCIKCGGGRMQQAGACKVCLDCGESGGCG